MSLQEFSRQINIEFVGNLRDLGGYRTQSGRRITWRRLFRSGELRHKTGGDVALLRQETGLVSVLDLRGDMEIREESVSLLATGGIKYHNVPLIAGGRGPGSDGEGDLFARFTSMGEFYLFLMGHEDFGKRMVAALEVIADSENHPVLFHCTVGKDRTGILSAAVLSVLGVADEDIINDYYLTTSHMPGFIERMKEIPQAADMLENLPAYFWEASRESMALVLSEVRRNYGSIRGYLGTHGCDVSLFRRLESALLDGE
jgi:protein-tyrosine phosphatase